MTTALLIGRYQPFHKGHLEVVKKILGECDHLVIGIGSSQYSHTPDNPFTGGERLMMVNAALAEEGFSCGKCTVVTIPDINNNALWVSHVKTYCPEFDIVYTQNPLSKRLFEESDVRVKQQPMFDRHKYSGTEVRKNMLSDGPWEESIPLSVVKVIKRVGGVERLKSVVGSD